MSDPAPPEGERCPVCQGALVRGEGGAIIHLSERADCTWRRPGGPR